jgi:Family of unknown function (DUF6463)
MPTSSFRPRQALDLLAAGHTIWGLVAYRDQLSEIVRELPGSIGDGVFERKHSRDGRSSAFWFLFVTPLLLVISRLYDAAERADDREAMRSAGWGATGISTVGMVAVPRSGFAAGIAVGQWIVRRSRA